MILIVAAIQVWLCEHFAPLVQFGPMISHIVASASCLSSSLLLGRSGQLFYCAHCIAHSSSVSDPPVLYFIMSRRIHVFFVSLTFFSSFFVSSSSGPRRSKSFRKCGLWSSFSLLSSCRRRYSLFLKAWTCRGGT